MTTQLRQALSLVEGRAHADRDLALVRTVELALEQQRRPGRVRRFLGL